MRQWRPSKLSGGTGKESTEKLISEIEHIWQMIYRFGFYQGGPVLMSALSGVRRL